MKLSYRGNTYEYSQPTLEVTEGEILGRYRGAYWRCRTLAELPIATESHVLQYRGVSYASNPTTGIRPVEVAQNWRPRAVAQSSKPSVDTASNELARIHRLNLQQRLERRLQAARERGDTALVSLLEAERKTLAL